MTTPTYVVYDVDRLSHQMETNDPDLQFFDLAWTYTDSNELEDNGLTLQWVDSEIERMRAAGVPAHVLEQAEAFRRLNFT